MDTQREWSDQTFDDGNSHPARSLSLCHHLSKEVKELGESVHRCLSYPSEENISHVTEELADCQLLLLDITAHMGFTADQLISFGIAKHEVNKLRKWGTPDANGVVEHVRG